MSEASTRRGLFRRNLWTSVIAAALVVVSIVAGLTWNAQHVDLARQEARIDELAGRLADVEQENDERVEVNVLESLGVSRSRMDTDAAVIESLLDVAFTWDSGVAYDEARERLKDRFGLTEDDVFLQEFMPPSRFNEVRDGQRYYYIDAVGLNSAIGDDPDIEVVEVRASDYAYAVLVDIAITSDAVSRNDANSASVTAHRPMLLFVTVDADGAVSELSGVPASGSTRHSG
ncbi:hypothetical protein ACFS27_13980 [Promicromonospora vindobonensis]|uniref:Tfp pilus assembly protein PilN n=1 Tax=Promicromonospora vindobonensis TaxID=195748 RepID=A0ABW5VUQ5_9MICO